MIHYVDHRLSLLQLIEMNCLGLYWNTSGVSSFASLDLTTEQMIVSISALFFIHRTVSNLLRGASVKHTLTCT